VTSPLALPILDTELEARLSARMDEVEKALHEHVESEAPFVTEAARHLMEAGGKRFRPLLCFLAAETGDASAPGCSRPRASWSSPTWRRCTTTT
jgi:heptaprenyl diphosphate synthase